MPDVWIQNKHRPLAQPLQARWCASFLCQLRGLMFVPALAPERGLLLVGERDSRLSAGIHMLWMNFDLAAVWVNAAMQVVSVQRARRWRPMMLPERPARYVLEAHISRLEDFQVGDEVNFAPC